MEAGGAPHEVNPWGLRLYQTLQPIEPESASEQAAYGKWLDQTSDREQARQDRLHGAEGIIPWPLWAALIFIAAVIGVFMLFFADSGEPKRVQAVQIGSVTIVIVVMLLLIRFLDSPFKAGPGRSRADGHDADPRRSSKATSQGSARAHRPRATRRGSLDDGDRAAATVVPRRSSSPPPCCSRSPPSRPPGAATRRRGGTGSRPSPRPLPVRPGSRRPGQPTSRTPRPRWTSRPSWPGQTRTRHDDQELADFYHARFRAEFAPAVDAWLATRPLQNPEAPLTPFAMPEYKLAASADADRLDKEAEVLAATVRQNLQRASNYVLGVVLCSVALFFGGASTKLASPSAAGGRRRRIGCVVFLGTLAWLASFPVSLAV